MNVAKIRASWPSITIICVIDRGFCLLRWIWTIRVRIIVFVFIRSVIITALSSLKPFGSFVTVWTGFVLLTRRCFVLCFWVVHLVYRFLLFFCWWVRFGCCFWCFLNFFWVVVVRVLTVDWLFGFLVRDCFLWVCWLPARITFLSWVRAAWTSLWPF